MKFFVDVMQGMAGVPNAAEILPKITTTCVGCTSVTDRQTTDGRQHIANVNVSEFTFAKNLGIFQPASQQQYC